MPPEEFGARCLPRPCSRIVFGSLALAGAPRKSYVMLGAAILAGSFGPLTSDVALGQVALLAAAGVIVSLLLLRTKAWLSAALASVVAALQPNLALVLLARLSDLRALAAFAVGFLLFATLELVSGGGFAGFASYIHLLWVHGAAERYTAIQISPGAIAYGFGAGDAVSVLVQGAVALLALAAMLFALRATADVDGRVGLAICALPFVVPFFHEHDFLLALLPATICAVRANGRTLGFAAFASCACGVDWLGLGQRPNGEVQSTVLALAAALGFALLSRLRPHAWAGLAVPVAVVAVSMFAHAHAVPIWPDALPPHWHPPSNAPVSTVWELEQRFSGLAQLANALPWSVPCGPVRSARWGSSGSPSISRFAVEPEMQRYVTTAEFRRRHGR